MSPFCLRACSVLLQKIKSINTTKIEALGTQISLSPSTVSQPGGKVERRFFHKVLTDVMVC